MQVTYRGWIGPSLVVTNEIWVWLIGLKTLNSKVNTLRLLSVSSMPNCFQVLGHNFSLSGGRTSTADASHGVHGSLRVQLVP